MITPSAPPSGTTISAVIEWDLFFRLMTEFSVSRFIPPKSICELPCTSSGRPASSGVETFDAPIVEGQDVVLHGFDEPEPLQVVQLVGLLLPRGRGPDSNRCWCRKAPRRRRRRRAGPRRSPTGCCDGSPRSSPCGRCRGCRTSRSTASRGARAPPRRRRCTAYSRRGGASAGCRSRTPVPGGRRRRARSSPRR